MRFLQSLISAIAGWVTPSVVPQAVVRQALVPLASVALPVEIPPPGVPLLSGEDRSSRSSDRNRSRSSSRFSRRGRFFDLISRVVGPAAGCRIACQTLLILLVCGLPWWFGGVQPWAQVVSFGVLAIASAFGLGSLILGTEFSGSGHSDGRFSDPTPRLFWLLVLGGGLGLLQILPLPSGVLRVISPHSAAYWERLTPRPTEPAEATAWGLATGDWGVAAPWRTISLYPQSTRRDLLLYVAALATFLLGSVAFRSDRSIRTLFLAVAACGVALGFFGLAQQLTWNGKLYGIVELTGGGGPFASYVNRNNAAGWLNLSLACSAGLFVWSQSSWLPNTTRPQRTSTQEASAVDRTAAPTAAQYLSSPLAGKSRGGEPRGRAGGAVIRRSWTHYRDALVSFFANLDGLQLFAALASCLILGAVLCSLSRGGFTAAVLSLVLAVLASSTLVRSKVLNALAWTCLLLFGIGLTAWVGRWDELQRRAGSLSQIVAAPDSRWGHWNDALAAAAEFPLMGSGFGTHRFLYRLHEMHSSSTWFMHAENQYVEALVEGGMPGLLLLLAAVAISLRASWRLLRGAGESADFAIGLAGLLALSTQAIHAFTDFGLYMPANMLLLALLAGVLHGRAASRAARAAPDSPPREAHRTTPPRFQIAFFSCFALVLGWGATQLTSVARADSVLRELRLEARRTADSSATALPELPTVEATLARLEPVAMNAGGFAEVHLRTAEAWLERYRIVTWQSLVALSPQANPERLWQQTSPAETHTWVRYLEQNHRTIELEDYRRRSAVRENLLPAVRHLLAARDACPLLPTVHLWLAELAPVVSERPSQQFGIEPVLTCAPADPQLLAEGGLVALARGEPQVAADCWRVAIEHEPTRLIPLLRLAASQPEMLAELERMLPNDPEWLLDQARDALSGEPDRALRERVAKFAKEIGSAAKIDEARRHYLNGRWLLLVNQPEKGVEELTRATSLEPMAVVWRFELATALADLGQRKLAQDHADFCVRMEPQNARYSDLLKRLIRAELTSP